MVGAAAGEDVPGLRPCCLPERRRRGAQVCPWHGDPAAVMVVADPDPGDVVRVVMHFPAALVRRDPRRLAAVGVQRLAVVGPPADLDAVGVDHPPGDRQQLEVVPGGQRRRHVAGDLEQRGVLLVRCQRRARSQRVPQPVMRAVLPVRDDPFIEQVLQFDQ